MNRLFVAGSMLVALTSHAAAQMTIGPTVRLRLESTVQSTGTICQPFACTETRVDLPCDTPFSLKVSGTVGQPYYVYWAALTNPCSSCMPYPPIQNCFILSGSFTGANILVTGTIPATTPLASCPAGFGVATITTTGAGAPLVTPKVCNATVYFQAVALSGSNPTFSNAVGFKVSSCPPCP